ncbi:uncharacterized protein J3D65DRAFT_476924 [Phyllosticta citribraziliensis]|uniref:Uncharacterized protein n=1 Tax=Phyllosticta citribraziliensis TaxID=989973 RepID=A0ABR1LHN6_9PEZI
MSLNHLFAREDYGFGCPDGGEWYSCGSGTKFVGCCTKDPCNDVGCGDGTLKKATFDSSKYGEFPDLSCNAGNFYTCNFTSPPFWGCCTESPCGNTTGCPQSDLAAAFLPNNAAQASPYSPTGGPSTTATSTATSTPSSGDDSHGTGTVIGAAVGGAVAGCLILGLAIWFCLRHRRKTRAKQTKDDIPAEEIPAVKPELSASDSVRIKGAVYPPRYSSIVNTEAFELEDTGRGTSELQGDDASHIRPELDGSDVGDTMSELDGSSAPSSPRGLRRSAMVAAARVKKLAPSHGGGGDEKSELSVSAHGSPKSSPSPHSMSFPRDSDSAVSSEASSPLTPRFLAPHASPKHPPIIEETREDHG